MYEDILRYACSPTELTLSPNRINEKLLRCILFPNRILEKPLSNMLNLMRKEVYMKFT